MNNIELSLSPVLSDSDRAMFLNCATNGRVLDKDATSGELDQIRERYIGAKVPRRERNKRLKTIEGKIWGGTLKELGKCPVAIFRGGKPEKKVTSPKFQPNLNISPVIPEPKKTLIPINPDDTSFQTTFAIVDFTKDGCFSPRTPVNNPPDRVIEAMIKVAEYLRPLNKLHTAQVAFDSDDVSVSILSPAEQ